MQQSCYSNPHQMAAAAAAAAAAAQNCGASGESPNPGLRLPFPVNFPGHIPNMSGATPAEVAATIQSLAASSPAKLATMAGLDTSMKSVAAKLSPNGENTKDGRLDERNSDGIYSEDEDEERESVKSNPEEKLGGSKEENSEEPANKQSEEINGDELKENNEEIEKSTNERTRKRRASDVPLEDDLKSAKLHGETDDDDDDVDDDDLRCGSGSPPSLTQTEIKVQRPLGLLAQHGLTVKPSGSAGSQFPRAFNPQSYFSMMGFGMERRMSADMDSEPESGRGRDSDRDSDSDHDLLHSREMMQAAAAAAAAASGVGRDDFLHHFDPLQRQKLEKDHMGGMMSPNQGLDFSNHLSLMDRRFMPSPPPSTSPSNMDPNHTPTPSSSSGHHWTFEEQFKQLYEMSPEPKRKEFLDDLFTFMQKRGTPVNRIPIMAKQTLDLYELFRLVVSKGGLVEVINKKLWREITKGLNLPSSITSAAFTLRTQYMKYLYPYECEKLKLSSLAELQSAIDGNRREGRRPGYGYDFSPLPTMMSTPPTPHMNGSGGLRPLNSSRPSTEDDRPMLTGPSVAAAAAAAAAHSQLRSLSEHDARAMEAATRAMEEVSKRMEEASRAAALASGVMGTPTGTGPGPRLLGGGPPLGMGGNKFEDTPPACKRPPTNMFEDERFLAQMGIHSTHIKLSSRSNGRLEYDSSMVISMEINGIMYQGVLFAQHPRRI